MNNISVLPPPLLPWSRFSTRGSRLTHVDDIIALLEGSGGGADGAGERFGGQVHHHGTSHGVAHQSLPRLLEEGLGHAGQERTADDGVHDCPNLKTKSKQTNKNKVEFY